jgi:hypothetical protein
MLIYTGVLAYGIGHLDGSLGYRGWRYIYVIEGVFSFLVGLIAVFTLQDTPQKTRGWLSETDKRFLELRTKFMYGGGGMGSKNDFRWPDVVKAMKASSGFNQGRTLWLIFAVDSHLDPGFRSHLQHHSPLRFLAFSTHNRAKYGFHRSRCSGIECPALHICLNLCGRFWALLGQVQAPGLYRYLSLDIRFHVSPPYAPDKSQSADLRLVAYSYAS